MKIQPISGYITKGAKPQNPKPYWIAVYAVRSNLPDSGTDISDDWMSVAPGDAPFVAFSSKPTQADVDSKLDDGEVLLGVFKVDP
jgi:hypothetical protein